MARRVAPEIEYRKTRIRMYRYNGRFSAQIKQDPHRRGG
jgi:hypothetical protein